MKQQERAAVVPEGQARIAQRFNVGDCDSLCISPEGTVELTSGRLEGASIQPSLRDSALFCCVPTLKRWAIVSNPSGMSKIVGAHLSVVSVALFKMPIFSIQPLAFSLSSIRCTKLHQFALLCTTLQYFCKRQANPSRPFEDRINGDEGPAPLWNNSLARPQLVDAN